MNGQIDYLKLLQEGDHNLSSFNEGIGDFLPAIIYVYDISERKIN
jgi:hypothetical protein